METIANRITTWGNEHVVAFYIALIAILFLAVILIGVTFGTLYNIITGYGTLKGECLQYETIGDMPAKCMDLFD